ncbi:hypothetical protein KI387_014303, partial [Taxus chinensis]
FTKLCPPKGHKRESNERHGTEKKLNRSRERQTWRSKKRDRNIRERRRNNPVRKTDKRRLEVTERPELRVGEWQGKGRTPPRKGGEDHTHGGTARRSGGAEELVTSVPPIMGEKMRKARPH